MLLMMGVASAQIAGGVYSVGSGGAYETLADAITELNSTGISGNVTLEFMDGHVEDGYNIIGNYDGNADYELVIRPEAGAASVEIINSANGKILDFTGARNVTLDGRAGGIGSPVLTLTNNSTSGALAGISFEGQTENVTVSHCNIVFKVQGIRTIGGGINDPEELIIENCRFSTSVIDTAIPYMLAINHDNTKASSVTIRNNIFESPNVSTGSIGTYTAISSRSGLNAYNNVIAVGDIDVEKIYGIYVDYGIGGEISHNTIAFDGGSTSNATTEVYPLYFNHSGTATVSNNIIYNSFDCGSGCTRGAIKQFISYGGSLTAENNAFGLSFSTAALNAYYLYNNEVGNVVSEFPDNKFLGYTLFNFVDFANNDLSLTESALLNEPGFRTLNPSQTTDINGDARNAGLATRGAVESPFSDADNNIYNVTAPEFSGVTIQRFTTTGSFTVRVENPTANLTFSPVFTLAPGATISPESGQPFDFGETIQFSPYFTVTAANGTDSFIWFANITGENPWSGGTYSIGTGGDFASITEASNAFAIFGIDNDVILELEDGYNGEWTSFFTGSGLVDHTITIRPEAGATEITQSFHGTGGYNIILDGRPGGVGESVLTFKSLSFAVFNGGSIAEIRHVKFLNLTGINGQNLYGLRVIGNTANVVVENCDFTTNGFEQRGILQGVFINGAESVSISNNKFYDITHRPSSSVSYLAAIDIGGTVEGTVDVFNNSISLAPERAGANFGIRLQEQVSGSVKVFHNTINIEDSGSGNATGIYTGIEVLGDPSDLQIKNNIIANTSPGTRRGFQWTTGTGARDVDYNNVSGTLPLQFTTGITSTTDFKSTYINSSAEDVSFNDPSVGDLSLNSSLNNNSQIRTILDAGIPNDINGIARGSFPMKGAYEVPGSGFNDILRLTFENSADLVIDAENATVSASAHPDTDLSSLAVDILVPPGASITPDPTIARDYTSPVAYTVTSEDDIDKVWSVTISERNVAPEGLTLSSPEVDENAGNDAIVSVLLPYDPNSADTHDFDLVSGDGDDDNNSFSITDNIIYARFSLNHEGKATRSVRIRVTDQGGLSTEFIREIAINDLNEAPDGLDVDENEFDEGVETGTMFTTLYIDDEDDGDTFSLAFVAGEGDDDNGKFEFGFDEIDEEYFLITLVDFDFESQSEFSVRMRVTDAGGLLNEFVVQIFVYDVDEAPEFADQIFEINENSSNGTLIGQIAANDPEEGTLTFSDLAGEIGAVFQISSDGQLTVEDGSFLNFEESDFFEFEAEVTDGEFVETATIRVNVLDVNEAPTDVFLSNLTINESNPTGSIVGNLSPQDEDQVDTHTYALKEGNTDNEAFDISGDQLVTAELLDFETKSTYNLEIIVTDQGGLTFEQEFAISVNDLPAQITAIELDNSSINENENAGTLVGNLSTFGEDLSGSFTYDLVDGSGSDDNASFSISNDQLLTSESFDFEIKNSYSIRVMVDDGSLTSEEIFTISITNVNEAPIVIASLNDESAEEGFGSTSISYAGVFSDPDGDDLNISVSSSSESVVTASVISGNQIQILEVGVGVSTITVTANDGNGGTISDDFTFTVTEAPLGLTEDLNLKVYPNPTADFINIGANKSLNVQLIDLNGRILQIANGQHIQLDLGAVKAGIYLLKISDGNSTETKRIIKAN